MEDLIDVCLGRVEADLVLECGALLNVFTGEILEDVLVAVKGGRIAYVGRKANLKAAETLKVKGLTVPGFIDAHTHIDLICTPTEQAGWMLAHGTTSIFTEPDELASVLGFRGLKIFVEEVRRLPLRVYVLIPLTTPQNPEVSTLNVMPLKAYREALKWPEVVGLGETVAWPMITSRKKYYMDKFRLALRVGKLIEGHTAGARNTKLAACVCSGVSSCHEAVDGEQALERLRLGLFLMIREGSLRRDLPQILPELLSRRVSLENAALVTDWVDPADLLEHGYMDYVVRRAIEYGVDPVRAIQMVTLNPARHFRLENLIGAVAPGRYADLVVLENLENPKVKLTLLGGRVVARDEIFLGKLREPRYPRYSLKTVRVHGKLRPEDFKLKPPVEGRVKAFVAKLESEAVTRKTLEEVEAVGGDVRLNGLSKIAVIDRHHGSGRIGLGLVRGFAEVGAVASTLNFDENQLVVVGCRNEDMARAANEAVKFGGGIVLVDGGEVLEALPMPVAGVISMVKLKEASEKLKRVNWKLREAGSRLRKPLNFLFFSTFTTLPELRFTDRGILDVKSGRYLNLFPPQT
ncbi:MAG: hypothetical protein DRO52_00245 [Candidatus Hecatellales archaeon]|nr:MAG: hypothetical protein DRO52_00245 [Candidatus Hecatellales archaeon]